MTRDLIVSSTPQETKAALLEDGVVSEIFIEREAHRGIAGYVYKGVVTRVLPGMQSAFVDLGLERDAFLHVADVFAELPENLLTPEEQQAAAAQSRNAPIEERLREGQEVLVQVLKEPLGTKGARITSHVSLPGRYLVFMPTVEHVGVSRKITDEEERRRLKTALKEIRQERGGGGFIARTAGQGRSREDFDRDSVYLGRTWDEARARAARERAPVLLYRELSLVQRLLRDILSDDIASIRLDSEREFRRTLDLVNQLQPELAPRVRLWDGREGILDEHGVSTELERALRPKVWLPSGGYIVINQTEALVAIDVNTGRFVGKKTLEETLLRANLDAVQEIVRQIRLRDLGGIIVVDFIDMEDRKSGQKVMAALEHELKRDRSPFEASLRQRVRPRDPHAQARAAVAGAHPLPDLPLLHGQRDDQERRHRLLGDLRGGQEAPPRRQGPAAGAAGQPRRGPRPGRRRGGGPQGAAGLVDHEVVGAGRPAAPPGAVRRGPDVTARRASRPTSLAIERHFRTWRGADPHPLPPRLRPGASLARGGAPPGPRARGHRPRLRGRPARVSPWPSAGGGSRSWPTG